jgi:gliding motility-associated-like protein
MLFDITGHNPSDAYQVASLVVIGNWAGTYGLTGAANGGSSFTQCASYPPDDISSFSIMPTLIKGHKYLLLISHYTDTQSGYTLTFGGGTASITDPNLPLFQSVAIACDRKSLTVVTTKEVRCNSLASNGSDFSIASNPVSVTGASGFNCNDQFDMDSIQLTLSAPLSPGNYSLVAQLGIDDNTLLDDCHNQVPVGANISFTVLPPEPTPLDSLTPPGCAPATIQLVFSDSIQCNSIAPDGSDFTISGNSTVGISKAEGICTNGLTHIINITLASPVVVGGNYKITLAPGTDGNTILNQCGGATPAGSTILFSTMDTVSASFGYHIGYGCTYDTINLSYLPANGVNKWLWNIDSDFNDLLPDPSVVETVFGPKNVQHIVSNGFCSDTVSEVIALENELAVSFQAPLEICPKDAITINNTTIGQVVSWTWNFGDGTFSNQQNPPDHLFPNTANGKSYTVSLVAQNNFGCLDSVSKQITKLQSCYVAVPNAFTPNGDGKNDYLYPLNAFSATNLEFRVYNRFGQLVFETRDWTQKWDGTMSGTPQPVGTYVWTLRYTDISSGKNFFSRGTTVLIR